MMGMVWKVGLGGRVVWIVLFGGVVWWNGLVWMVLVGPGTK